MGCGRGPVRRMVSADFSPSPQGEGRGGDGVWGSSERPWDGRDYVVVRRVASADFCLCRSEGRAGTRPGRRPTFLFAQESRQTGLPNSAPRLPGPAGGGLARVSPVRAAHGQTLAMRNPALTPRCGRPAGPVAKPASKKQLLGSVHIEFRRSESFLKLALVERRVRRGNTHADHSCQGSKTCG